MGNRSKRLTPLRRAKESMENGNPCIFVPAEVLGLASLAIDADSYHSGKYPGIAGLHLESHAGMSFATATDGAVLAQACWNQASEGDTQLPPTVVPREICDAIEIDNASEALLFVQQSADGLLLETHGKIKSLGQLTATREFVSLGVFPDSNDAFQKLLNEKHEPEELTTVYVSLHRLRQVLDAIDGLCAVGIDEIDVLEISIRGPGDHMLIRTSRHETKVRAVIMPMAVRDQEPMTEVDFKNWPEPRTPGNPGKLSPTEESPPQ